MAIGDLDGNGHGDLVVANSATGAGTVTVLFNSGTGTFFAKQSFPAGITTVYGVEVGDFDNDGIEDLAATGTSSQVTTVLLGNGDGTFLLPITAGPGGWRVNVGDFNGDSKQDLVVGGSIKVLLGNGDGTFGSPILTATTTIADIAVADFNGDGTLDLASPNSSSQGSLYVLLGNGNGSFKPAASYVVAHLPSELTIADFDGDSILDVAVASADPNGNSVYNDIGVLRGTGLGTFEPAVTYQALSSYGITAGDFDGDGDDDIVVTAVKYDEPGTVLLNQNGHLISGFYPVGPSPVSAATGDFNADGHLDFAVANDTTSGTIYILFGAGNGAFQGPIGYAAGKNPKEIAVTDLNLDGTVDLAVATESGTIAFIGNGDGTFQSGLTYGPSTEDLTVADFNGDGFPDVVASNDNGGSYAGKIVVLQNAADWPPLPIVGGPSAAGGFAPVSVGHPTEILDQSTAGRLTSDRLAMNAGDKYETVTTPRPKYAVRNIARVTVTETIDPAFELFSTELNNYQAFPFFFDGVTQ